MTTNVTTSPDLSRRAARFAHMTALLADHTRTHDGANPGQHVKVGPDALGEWVVTQRSRYRGVASKTPLTTAEIAALEAAGIIWAAPRGRGDNATRSSSISAHLSALARYKDVHGHANPPASTVMDGLNLGYWLRNRRQDHAAGRLDPALGQDLLDLGVTFRNSSPLKVAGTAGPSGAASGLARAARGRSADKHFDQMTGLLLAYRNAEGDVRVPRSYITADGTALGVWVSDQRQAFARGELSPQRIAALDEIGMIWVDTPGRRDFARTFAARLVCAGRYAADHDGNGNAPASFSCDHEDCDKKDLGQWLHRLRKKYAADLRAGTSKVTAEQIEALTAAGVNLDPQGRAARAAAGRSAAA